MLQELQAQLNNVEKDLQIVNSLLSLQSNKDYKIVFDNYLFKDKILEISSLLRFGSEEINNIYYKQIEALVEINNLVKTLIKSKSRLEQTTVEIKESINNYMENSDIE